MDKLQMAHEYALKMIDQGYLKTVSREHIAFTAFGLADAMQSKWDERSKKPLTDIITGCNNAEQENLAEQDAQMYGIGLIRILKKGDQLEYMRLNPKDVELNYRDTLSPEVAHLNNTLAVQKIMYEDEWQPTGYEP